VENVYLNFTSSAVPPAFTPTSLSALEVYVGNFAIAVEIAATSERIVADDNGD